MTTALERAAPTPPPAVPSPPGPSTTSRAAMMGAVSGGDDSDETSTEAEAGAAVTSQRLLADLESEMAALWQLRKARARELAHLLHPRLDPTALPLIAAVGVSGALRPSDLVRQLHLDPSTVSRQITATERLGLVARLPDPSDARARLIDLTPAAREQVTTYRDQLLEQWRRSLTGWPPGDVEQLTTLLHRLRQDW